MTIPHAFESPKSDSYPYSHSVPFGFEVVIPAEHGLRRWITGIRLTLASCTHCFSDIRFMEYSPGEEDLVVPASVRDRFIQHVAQDVGVGSDRRLFGPCSWRPRFGLDFGSSNLLISLTSNQFRAFPSAGDTTCSFRIRFDDSMPNDKITVGRLLTRSAGGVALDYHRRLILVSRLNVLRPGFERGYNLAVSLVPVFQPPIVSAMGIELQSSPMSRSPRNLVLSNLRESSIQFGALAGRGFVFYKTSIDLQSEASFRIVRQLTNLSAPDIDLAGQRISFTFDDRANGGEWDVVLIENAYSVLIVTLRRQAPSPPAIFLEELDLGIPEFKLYEREGDESSVCSICLDPIEEGEMEQTLNPCKHRFHFRCITNWLKTRYLNPTCPVCRTKVPKLASIPESSSASFRGTS